MPPKKSSIRNWMLMCLIASVGITGLTSLTGCLLRDEDHGHDHDHDRDHVVIEHHDDDHDRR
jgi:hypothetical protein